MTERQLTILGAVVEEYAATCEPVGSNAIVRKYPIGVSSATVRNEMAELEAQGYLLQLHTSSGRVPSDLGYRTYVTHLLERGTPRVNSFDSSYVKAELSRSFEDFDGLLRQAALSLADFTGYTALALSPQADELSIDQIQFVEIQPRRLLLLLVLKGGLLQDKQIRLQDALSDGTLERFNRLLKICYTGRRLSAMTFDTIFGLAVEAGVPEKLAMPLTEDILRTAEEALDYVLYLEGLANLFRQPEFQDAERAVEILDYFKSKDTMTDYLAQGLTESGEYFIRIGSDLSSTELQDCTLLGMRYQMESGSRGYLAILGPRRMAYRDVIRRVAFVQKMFNTILEKYALGDD